MQPHNKTLGRRRNPPGTNHKTNKAQKKTAIVNILVIKLNSENGSNNNNDNNNEKDNIHDTNNNDTNTEDTSTNTNTIYELLTTNYSH